MLAQIAARGSFRSAFALRLQPQRCLLQKFGPQTLLKRPALCLNAPRHLSVSSILAQDKKEALVTLSERAQQARKVNLRAKLQSPEVKSSASRREFSRLFELVKSERKALTVGLLLLVFTSGISLTLPAVIGKILDAVNDPSPDKMIFGLPLNNFFAATMCVFATGAVALYFRIVVMRSIGERIVARLRARVFRRIVEQDAEFFDANRTGDLISRLGNDANVVSRAVTQNVADGLRSVLTAVMGVSAMAYISPQMTVLIGAVLPPVLIGTWLYGRKVRAIALNFQKGLGELTRVAEERLNNIRTAQSFGCETLEMRLYNKEIRKVFGIAMQDAKASGIYSGTMQLTGNTVVIGLLAYGASMVSSGSLTFGELSSFIMYTAFAGSAVSGLGNFYSELMKGAGAAQRLFEVEDRKPVIPPFQGEKLNNPRGDIVFDKVKFAYPTRPAVEIFSDLSVKIKAGSHVVIVGQSGGGKSTIISLLMRFYDPTFGNITIGGQKLTDMSPWALRHHIGIVAQEPVLFSGSIADNIRYGKPGASDQDVLTAAMQANCTFLSDFPEGLDTMVGPRGAQLSGGQKQRIAIARAIISKPAILILDEATSALDGESEMLVNEALNKLIRSTATTISIAHRLSTIARAEEVIVLGQGGKVVEQGPFNRLYSQHDSALSKLLLKRHEMPLPNHEQTKEDEPEDILVDETIVDETLEAEAEKSRTKL